VVTKLGIHITPAPKAYIAYNPSMPKERDLPQLIELLADIQRRGIVTNQSPISNVFRQAILFPDDTIKAKLASHFYPNKSIPESILDDLKLSYGW
jgi:hypothetical protein